MKEKLLTKEEGAPELHRDVYQTQCFNDNLWWTTAENATAAAAFAFAEKFKAHGDNARFRVRVVREHITREYFEVIEP